MQKNKIFLKLLEKEKIISAEKLQELVEINNNNAFDILLSLVKYFAPEKNRIGKLWGNSLNVAYADLSKVHLHEEIIKKIPEDLCKKYNLIALYQFGNVLTVAISDPLNEIALNSSEQHVNMQISPVFSFPEDIKRALKTFYKSSDSLEALASKYFASGQQSDKKEPEPPPSLVSNETKEYLVNNVKNVLTACENNKTPDRKICELSSEKITKEVNDKFHLVQCINQFRITDEYAYAHSINVAMLSAVMLKVLGFSEACIKEITLAALLHDIGKVRIPKEILYKKGALTWEEKEIIKKHPEWGYEIVRNFMRLPDQICEVVRNHHERNDGTGYPSGLKGHKLSLYTQIVSIIDIYDALISDRPYRKAVSQDRAINIMLLEGHVPFDFDLMYKFVVLVYKNEFKHLKENFKSVVYG